MVELLIVVAIIGILVAVSIPIFSAQLEKSREAVDAANIRAVYAEMKADYLTDKVINPRTVTLTQKQSDWQGPVPEIGDAVLNKKNAVPNIVMGNNNFASLEPGPNGEITITYRTRTK